MTSSSPKIRAKIKHHENTGQSELAAAKSRAEENDYADETPSCKSGEQSAKRRKREASLSFAPPRAHVRAELRR